MTELERMRLAVTTARLYLDSVRDSEQLDDPTAYRRLWSAYIRCRDAYDRALVRCNM